MTMSTNSDWKEYGQAYRRDLRIQEQLKQPGFFWRADPSSELRVKAKIPIKGKQRQDAKLNLFLAGGLAGGIAKTVGSPLSRATITMQTQAALGKPTQGLYTIMYETVKKEGVRGLCKGNGMDVLRSVPMTGLSFLTYGVIRKTLQERTIFTRDEHAILQALMSGSVAGMTAITTTYPLDLLRAQVIVAKSPDANVSTLFKKIIQTDGVAGLYKGLNAAILASVPKLALSFATNETVSHMLIQRGWEDGALLHITAGCTAGMIASSATFPADVVMRSMQVGSVKYNGVLDCFTSMLRQHGWKVFFNGLTPELMKSVPVQTTALVVNSWALRQLGVKRAWDKD